MTSLQDVRSAAAKYSALAARNVDMVAIRREFPDSGDAERVLMMALAADLKLEWSDPWIERKIKVVAIMGSFIWLPVLAVIQMSCWVSTLAGWIVGEKKS